MIHTIGIGELQAAELERLLSPVSVVIDMRPDGSEPLPALQIPVDLKPTLSGPTNCRGELEKRNIDETLHDQIRLQIPNPWSYAAMYAYAQFTLTTTFLLEIEPLRFDGVCFLCNQIDWWLCQRAILADYLAFRGYDILHLGQRQWRHRDYFTGRLERYDPQIIKQWEKRANA